MSRFCRKRTFSKFRTSSRSFYLCGRFCCRPLRARHHSNVYIYLNMRLLFIFFAFFALNTAVFAQKGDKCILRGNVYDKDSAEPIGFATVKFEGMPIGTTTDVNGFFSLSELKAGTYNLVVSYLGYDDYKAEIKLEKGQILFQNIYIKESGQRIETVTISGKKEQAKSDVQISKIAVTAKQIRALPSTGGQADIAQYLTVLPGVVFTGDQGGQLYIRGGSPVQNRILLDGMTIFNPFHSIGFYSVFETELIRNVDVLTGGFNADYGGRISAVVDVKTREGNRKRLAGLVSASPFMAKAILEGPIVPLKKEGGSSMSVVFAGKKGLINQTDKLFYNYVDSENGIPFDFTDYYGKLSLNAGNGSKLNIFGFQYNDKVDYPISDFSWNTGGLGIDFTMIPQNSNLIISGNFAFSGYETRIEEADRKERNSGLNGFSGGLTFSNFGRNSELKYGLELVGFKTDFNFVNNRDINIEEVENNSEFNSFIRWKRKLGNLVIEPGFRLQYYQSLNNISPEPRLGLKYSLTNSLRLKAAAGLYSQNLLSTINERDIVNLFVGFLSSPGGALYEPGSTTNTISNRLQKASHAVAGVEIDLASNLDLNIEGYYKDFSQLIALNRNKKVGSDPNYFVETGTARGIDVSLKWEGKKAYLWGAYSLGFVRRNDGEQVYPPVFDRRHNMNLVATYQMGKKDEWEIGGRWNFGSGFPFTLTQGFYHNLDFGNGINSDVYGDDGSLGIDYATKRNGGRLPYYHRFDVSVKRMFEFTKHIKMEVTAACTNVYDRPNIFYFDRVRYTRVNQLPILPSLSMTLQF